MKIEVRSKRCSLEKLERENPGTKILDLSSKEPQPWVKFSPFYPHGGIPVPHYPELHSESVEGIWQGLKVFGDHDIDLEKLRNTTMKGLKRTVRRFGPCKGHRLSNARVLGYREARYQIYLPAYKWVLEGPLSNEVQKLKELAQQSPLIFLDYETNSDPDNLSKPLSHAGLVAKFLSNEWPQLNP